MQIDRIKNDGSRGIRDVINDQYSDYRVLGSSDFRSVAVGDYELKSQAATVGASLVAVFSGWVGTVQTGVIGNSVPLKGGGAIGIATAINNDVNEYHAIFLAKYAGKKERIGIEMANLPADVQQRLERNKGVLIVGVARGPAFDANILIGDVLVAINGIQVIDIASTGILVRDACRKGDSFVLSVLRGIEGKSRDISIANCM